MRVKVILALVLVAAAFVVALSIPRSNMRELSPEDLVLALKDRDGFVRGKAVEELIRRHDPQAVPLLVVLLKDSAEDVRWIAREPWRKRRRTGRRGSDLRLVRPCSSRGEGSGRCFRNAQRFPLHPTRLIQALGRNESMVKNAAAFALGELKDPKSVIPLAAALNDEVGAVRSNAALALGKIGDARAVDKLLEATTDPLSDVRMNAAWALGG